MKQLLCPFSVKSFIPMQSYAAASTLPAHKSQLLIFQGFGKLVVKLFSSLKSAMLTVFLPWAFANVTCQDFFPPELLVC